VESKRIEDEGLGKGKTSCKQSGKKKKERSQLQGLSGKKKRGKLIESLTQRKNTKGED